MNKEVLWKYMTKLMTVTAKINTQRVTDHRVTLIYNKFLVIILLGILSPFRMESQLSKGNISSPLSRFFLPIVDPY